MKGRNDPSLSLTLEYTQLAPRPVFGCILPSSETGVACMHLHSRSSRRSDIKAFMIVDRRGLNKRSNPPKQKRIKEKRK